jgi:hypothetical protein
MLLQLTLKAKLQTESLVMLYYFKAKIEENWTCFFFYV